MSKTSEVHLIIHSAATAAGGIGAGLAPIPGSDAVPLTALQVGMIQAIAAVHGKNIGKSYAASLIGSFSTAVTGRTISQWLVGWWPGLGSVINASTAFSLTEAIGWAAHRFFSAA